MNTRKRNKTVLLLAIMVMMWIGSVANADLVAYWPLDEGTGSIAYDAAGDNDGEFVGEPTWISPGVIGAGALYFGDTAHVNCGTGATAAPDLTVALWIKADNYGHTSPMDCSDGGYSTDPGWIVMLRTTPEKGCAWFRIHGTEVEWDDGDVQIPIDEPVYEPRKWVHMAFTFDSVTREQKAYINGQLKATDTAYEGRSVANTEIDLHFGGDWGYRGMLDDLAIWDNALTAEEVLNVYEIGVLSDANTPYVNAGPDMITLSDLSVDMDAIVVNRDTQDPNRPLDLEWTAIPSGGVVFSPNASVLNPTVTITTNPEDPNDLITYTLILSAQLVNPSGPPEAPGARSMEIDVWSDSCKAKIAAGEEAPYDPGDVNTDCATELKDFGQLAEKWFVDYRPTAPAEKPVE